jgi:hypothetical protein
VRLEESLETLRCKVALSGVAELEVEKSQALDVDGVADADAASVHGRSGLVNGRCEQQQG